MTLGLFFKFFFFKLAMWLFIKLTEREEKQQLGLEPFFQSIKEDFERLHQSPQDQVSNASEHKELVVRNRRNCEELKSIIPIHHIS